MTRCRGLVQCNTRVQYRLVGFSMELGLNLEDEDFEEAASSRSEGLSSTTPAYVPKQSHFEASPTTKPTL